MTGESIRVLVVEDHHVVRQGLVSLLNVVDGIEVVGEAADGIEAIAQFRAHLPDITLIDLRMREWAVWKRFNAFEAMRRRQVSSS